MLRRPHEEAHAGQAKQMSCRVEFSAVVHAIRRLDDAGKELLEDVDSAGRHR